ncbi:hypothetical protein [Streptomyces chartreusis]
MTIDDSLTVFAAVALLGFAATLIILCAAAYLMVCRAIEAHRRVRGHHGDTAVTEHQDDAERAAHDPKAPPRYRPGSTSSASSTRAPAANSGGPRWPRHMTQPAATRPTRNADRAYPREELPPTRQYKWPVAPAGKNDHG